MCDNVFLGFGLILFKVSFQNKSFARFQAGNIFRASEKNKKNIDVVKIHVFNGFNILVYLGTVSNGKVSYPIPLPTIIRGWLSLYYSKTQHAFCED